LKFKQKARDEKGKMHRDFKVEMENELWYGFTRKDKTWFATSCTLNSWVYRTIDAPEVVKNAGKKKSDKDKFKAKCINTVPLYLWEYVLPKLRKLTPGDGESWSLDWERSAVRGRLRKADFETRIRNLVKENSRGSKMYQFIIHSSELGKSPSAFKTLVKVLTESVKIRDKYQERCLETTLLCLSDSCLNDKHIAILAPELKKFVKLERLELGNNRIGAAGLLKLCQSLPGTVEQLELKDCGLGDNECNVICRKIPMHINEINLSKNRIGLSGCIKMIDLLSRSDNQLNIVFLDGNPGADFNVMKRLHDTVATENRSYYNRIREIDGFACEAVTIEPVVI